MVAHRPRAPFHVRPGFVRNARACMLAIVLLALTAHGTAASVGWCRADPVMQIEDALADIFVAVPFDALPQITGPTEFVITTPVDVAEAVLLTSPGFGYGESVAFRESKSLKMAPNGIPLRIKVFVPATDDTVPVLVEFAPRVVGVLAPASVEGTANKWISLNVLL